MDSALYLFLCVAVTFALGYCETKKSNDGERARLPEFLTELDMASLEASEDDVEALKKIVKRLAPEKNGVMGQPGIDFPVLTTIPTTAFSCRGLKGGYYADLETNCQVFHICDNGRKISFLCPNGTIFQQSQLICDWWFKVNCGKSTEFYDQSAEQLAEEERKRAETKRIKSEFHRVADNNDQTYYQTQKSDYDGKQNGRTNPFGQTIPSNQIQNAQQKSNQFGQNYIYNSQQRNDRTEDQYTQTPNIQENARANHLSESYNQKQPSPTFSKYNQPVNKQQNQLFTNQNGKANRFVGNYDQKSANKYQSTSQNAKENHESGSNQNPQQTDEQNSRNLTRSRTFLRNNLNEQVQKVTPIYTETTTFRTTTASPIKEYQQPAESAAFASSKGHRYNKAYNSNQFNNFYAYRIPSTENFQHESSTAYPEKGRNDQASNRHRGGFPTFPFPTFAPIYKPRTTTFATQKDSTTTQSSHVNTDYGEKVTAQTTYSSLDIVTPVVYSNAQDLHGNAETLITYDNTGNYQQNTVTPEPYGIGTWQNTKNPFTQKPYVNTEIYRENTESTVTPESVKDEESVKNYKDNTASQRDYEQSNGVVSTISPYLNTESYQQNTATVNAVTELAERNYGGSAESQPTIAHFENTQEQMTISLETQMFNWDVEKRQQSDTLFSTKQNWISSTTEKSLQDFQTNQKQNTVTEKSLSPYDTSFTYKQGKVISTLGPYVPFTKNYVYTTTTSTTTQKPPAYTATVPTYSSTISDYRTTEKNLIPEVRTSSSSSFFKADPRESATYLPAKTTDSSKFFTRQPAFEKRPSTEQEHAINMLHSLQDLKNSVPDSSESKNGSRVGLHIPNSSGPSTLHSLALYFATTSDNFDSKENNTDVTVNFETRSGGEDATTVMEDNSTAKLPTSILTQNTISSYAELFNLNNALESNVTTENRFGGNVHQEDQNEDDKNDLELQQSEGPLNGVKKSNNTKLRELAQVFTHALSAYLQDPDTFKKVLTEVRPTEPPSTTSDELSDATTLYPMATEDYSSVTKEKDEVLDFSDVTKASKRKRPTTPFPTTIRPILVGETTYQTYLSTTRDYYTTKSQYPADTPVNVDESSSEGARRSYFEKLPQPTENTFAFEVNHAFGTTSNDIRDYNTGPGGHTGPTGPSGASNEYDNYFPTGSSSITNRFGNVQTNTTSTPEVYDPQYVKSFDATQINDNYVSSSTPASYVQATISNENIQVLTSGRPRNDLVLPRFQDYNTQTIEPIESEKSTNYGINPTNLLESQRNEPATSTKRPFIINYYEATATDQNNDQESLVPAGSLYPNYENKYNIVEDTSKSSARPTTSAIVYQTSIPVVTTINQAETTIVQDDPVTTMQTSGNTIRYANQPTVDHWTSSPTVTKLWETTVFLDPKQINHGLTSDPRVTQPTNFDYDTTFPSNQEILVTDASSGITSSNFNTNPSTPWQWAPNSNDSPTAFTLLPAAYSTDNTATPVPSYMTHSSITTTITSSVSSSSNATPQKLLATVNITENEIAKAQEMFGNLNASSSNTLMRVMKQADNNATVRRLVLLLISHCDGPVNKTEDLERRQLLNALLKMPVNEFSSEESREVVAGINKLNLLTGEEPNVNGQTKRPMPTSVAPAVTTYRNRKGRKFKATTNNPLALSRSSEEAETAESNNSLSVEQLTESDNRALELLRSLYTIAAKWG